MTILFPPFLFQAVKTPTDIYDKLFGESANYQPEVKPMEIDGHRKINVMFDLDIRTIIGLVS